MDQIDLNNFELLNEIVGQGSFGEVRKVKEKKTGHIYAAKILFHVLDEDDDKALQFKREVEICSGITHPSIIQFKGYSLHDFNNEPKPVIILEYAKNKTLADVIELQRLHLSIWDDTKKLIIIYGIASGMAFLHSNKIDHRDLKPENILMDDYLYPKISDFGLSKINHQNQLSITAQSKPGTKGTPIYMSPEIHQEQKYGEKSDVYAFGIIVYEIITNKRPFEECKGIIDLILKVMNGIRPTFDTDVDETYKNLICRCWNHDPSIRPNFKEILDELENDEGFITDFVDENEYFKYIDYIQQCQKSFDKKKKIISISDFMKSKSYILNPVNIDFKQLSQSVKLKKESESNNSRKYTNLNSSTSSSASLSKQKILEKEQSEFRRSDKNRNYNQNTNNNQRFDQNRNYNQNTNNNQRFDQNRNYNQNTNNNQRFDQNRNYSQNTNNNQRFDQNRNYSQNPNNNQRFDQNRNHNQNTNNNQRSDQNRNYSQNPNNNQRFDQNRNYNQNTNNNQRSDQNRNHNQNPNNNHYFNQNGNYNQNPNNYHVFNPIENQKFRLDQEFFADKQSEDENYVSSVSKNAVNLGGKERSEKYRVHIKAFNAMNVLKMNYGGSDPYLRFRIKGKMDTKVKTQVISNTSSPIWNQELDVISSNFREDVLEVDMFNEDIKNDEKMMNTIEIPLINHHIGKHYVFNDIIKLNMNFAGKLHFEFDILPI